MGNDSGKHKSRHTGLNVFPEEEQANLQALFASLCGSDHCIQESKLLKHLGDVLPEQLIRKMLRHMTRDGGATAARFYDAVANILRGTQEEFVFVLHSLAGSDEQAVLTSTDLYSFVEAITWLYFTVSNSVCAERMTSWQLPDAKEDDIKSAARYILLDLFYPDMKQRISAGLLPPDKDYNTDDLLKWSASALMFVSFFRLVFQYALKISLKYEPSFVPLCVDKDWNVSGSLLTYPWLVSINQALPEEKRSQWKLLFHSGAHGESFANVMRVVKKQSDTVLILRDEDGYIFGAYTSAQWDYNAAFRGSHNCFLFSLYPTLYIYKASGFNTNYFYLNHGQETLPNGMGMGGQLNYFGLWLDEEYGRGHSMAKPLSTTFNSPQLSGQPHFTYTELEIWKVGLPPKKDTDEDGEPTVSILDVDPGAKAILELIGKGNLSDGIRESDPAQHSPSEKKMPVL